MILLVVGLVAVGAWLGYRALFDRGLLPTDAPGLPSLPNDLLPSPSPPVPTGWRIAPAAWAEPVLPADRRARRSITPWSATSWPGPTAA